MPSALRAVAALLAVLTVLSSACASQEKSRAQTATQGEAGAGGGPANGWVPLPSGGRLYYDVAGTKGDTIVVPGAVYWEKALKPLAQDHVVIFYDVLGRGRSDTASGSRIVMDSIVADLETLRKFFRVERIGLVGVSVNGLVAAGYAAAHPDHVARLALVNPGPPTAAMQTSYKPPERVSRTDSAAQKELLRMRETGASPEAICRQFWKASAGWFVYDRAAAARLDPTWCAVPNETVDASLLWLGYLSSAAGSFDVTAKARTIKAPTLVVRAERDYFVNPEGAKVWAAAIPGARLLSLPGVGHLAVLEKPEAVNAPLQEFFAGRWPAGAAAAK